MALDLSPQGASADAERCRALRQHRRGRALPPVAGALAAVAGLVNVASALTPNIGWRGHLLVNFEPVDWLLDFRALALPAGVALVVVGPYLAWRRRLAFRVALGLLLALGALNLLKGLDVEEAIVSWALAGLLWWGRPAFSAAPAGHRLREALLRLPLVLGAGYVVALIAVLVTRDRAHGHLGLAGVFEQAGALLLLLRAPAGYAAPFEDLLPAAVGAVGVLTLLAGAYLVFRPLAGPESLPGVAARGVARALVREHGTDTLAAFKLRADNDFFFSADRRAFVGYRTEAGVLLVSGDPVGPQAALSGLLRELFAFAETRGLRVAVLGASQRAVELFGRAGLRAFYVGDEALVDVEPFSLQGRPIRKLRQAVARVQRAGFRVSAARPADLSAEAVAELEAISERWRDGAPERGFCMAMDSLRGEHELDALVVVARDPEGAVRGFLHFVPVYGRSAMSLSFMRRDPETPNGLMEFLIVSSIELLRQRGVRELSLNFAAFARLLHSPESRRDRALGRLVAAANPHFQLESLYRFNAKFFPRWEARFLLYEGVLGLPRAALAAMTAEGYVPGRGPHHERRQPEADEVALPVV